MNAQAQPALQAHAYGLKRTTSLPYAEAVAKITETLKAEGFGVLTEIDVKKTLKTKLDKDFTDYIILGACNPPLAFKALTEEIDIGLLLPCNVTVYKDPANGDTVLAAINPETMLSVTGRNDLHEFAQDVKARLERALAAV